MSIFPNIEQDRIDFENNFLHDTCIVRKSGARTRNAETTRWESTDLDTTYPCEFEPDVENSRWQTPEKTINPSEAQVFVCTLPWDADATKNDLIIYRGRRHQIVWSSEKDTNSVLLELKVIEVSNVQ